MTFTLFWFSLIVLCGMVSWKLFEIKVRKVHFISNVFRKWDKKMHQLLEKTAVAYTRYQKIARIFMFDFLPNFAYELLVRMKDHVAKKYYEAGDNFRGRRILKSRGSVSFFLEKLSEEEPRASHREV